MTITCILRRLITANIRQTTRKFHGSPIIRSSTYEGDGKTTISILNKDTSYGLMIDSYSEVGFRMNNGIMILGAIAIFPKTVLSWKINSLNDINEETLSLFSVLEPKLDVLIIGFGSDARNPAFDKTIMSYAKKFKINMEVVPSNHACAIFNFLNAEGRFVGAGIIPPRVVSFTKSEILNNEKTLGALSSSTDL